MAIEDVWGAQVIPTCFLEVYVGTYFLQTTNNEMVSLIVKLPWLVYRFATIAEAYSTSFFVTKYESYSFYGSFSGQW